MTLADGTILRKGDPIITFVNRNLEPSWLSHLHPIYSAFAKNGTECAIHSVGSTKGAGYGAPALKVIGPINFWLKRRIHKSYVHFTGTLSYEHFLPLLRLSACHVYLTYPFVLSWSLLEAMSCACPVVGSATSPVEEVIRDGRNGLLVDFFSSVDLADAIAYMLNNPGPAAQMGQAARETILKNYSLDHCLPRQLQLINLVSTRVIGS